MSSVREPAKYISDSLDSKPSELRRLLRDMQNRCSSVGDLRSNKLTK